MRNEMDNKTTSQKGTTMLAQPEIDLMCRFIADYNGGEPEDYTDSQIDGTRDLFELYDGRAWTEATGRTDDYSYGVPARHFESVQAIKGQPRTALWVMDFGDHRAVYQQ